VERFEPLTAHDPRVKRRRLHRLTHFKLYRDNGLG
jgi:hypothetical protein